MAAHDMINDYLYCIQFNYQFIVDLDISDFYRLIINDIENLYDWKLFENNHFWFFKIKVIIKLLKLDEVHESTPHDGE